jgi:hypothetical protein
MFLGPSESPTIGEGRAEFAAKLPFEGGRVRSGEVQDQGVRLALAGRLDSIRLAISGYDTLDEDGRKSSFTNRRPICVNAFSESMHQS